MISIILSFSFSEIESCSFVALFTTVFISTWPGSINTPLSLKVKGIAGKLALINFYISNVYDIFARLHEQINFKFQMIIDVNYMETEKRPASKSHTFPESENLEQGKGV